jgi:hypothetical protein
MQKLLVVAIIASLGWYAYGKYLSRAADEPSVARAVSGAAPAARDGAPEVFRCDGRTHCSQMTSCAEATYFLRNCPGTKMDGNNDGVPCEKQWCK